MSANQAPNHIPPLPQMIAQYQQQVEFFNNQIGLIRRNLERTDISNDEKESLRKQEQEIQSKVSMLQSIINQMVTQRVLSQQQQQQQQQQISSPSSQQTGDNMSVNSAPGSPATFNPQQQQQQQQQFAAAQLRQQQQQQQQATLNKMGLVAQQLNNASPQNAFAIQQPQQVKPNPGTVPTSAAQAAAVAAAAAAAAKNNGGIFTFPTQPPQQPQQPQPQQLPQPQSNQMQTTTLTTAPSGTTMMMPATTTTTNNAPMNNNTINTGTATTSGIQPTPTAGAQIATPLKPAAVPSIDNDGVSRVLTKRKIQELVSQIDPSERLEPEVEDILLEIADEFIESVTTFACQLAKHRKSDTLEVKDVQLHLERNWNIRIPGFAADDIRPLRKPVIPSSHQVKVQAVNSAKNQASNTASKKEHHANNNNTNNN